MSMNQQHEGAPEAPAKENKGLIALLKSKRFRYGGFSIALILIVVAVVILANAGISTLDDNWGLRLDVTINKTYKLSPQTEKVIRELKEPIQLVALLPEGNTKITSTIDVLELMNRYRVLNPDMVTVKSIDPVRNPTYSTKFDPDHAGISEGSVIITNAAETRFRVVAPTDMFEMDFDMQTYQSYPKAFIGEQSLTNAAIFVTAENQQRVFFMTGHNEVSAAEMSQVKNQLLKMNLLVEEIDSLTISTLQPGDVLVAVAPQQDISEPERDALKGFLESGGMMIYLRSVETLELTNLESLFEVYGISVRHDVIIETDPARTQMGSPLIIVPQMQKGGVTDPLIANKLQPILPVASSFDLSPVEEYGRTLTALLTSSDKSYGRDAETGDFSSIDAMEGDMPGPRTLAASVEQTHSDAPTTKVVVIGNADFIAAPDWSGWAGNSELFYNSVRWMQGEGQSLSILGKSLLGNSLGLSSTLQVIVIAALVMVIPVVILIAGIVVWLRRRHL